MINYKNHLRLPTQIKKYNNFVNKLHLKNDPFSEDIEDNPSDFMNANMESLIDSVIAAYYKNDSYQLYKTLKDLNGFLTNIQPKIFSGNSDILPILIELSYPENGFEFLNTAYICLYNITALFSETTPILLNNGVMNVFYKYACTELNKKGRLIGMSIDGIVNLVNDEPQIISRLMFELPMSKIIGFPPFDSITSILLTKNVEHSIPYSINRLFAIYLENDVPPNEINIMIEFYYYCLMEQDIILRSSGLTGLNNLLTTIKLQENHYSSLVKIDFVDMSDEFNDDYENCEYEDEKEFYLELISYCFKILSRLFQFSTKLINYRAGQILYYCTYNPEDYFCHFDDKVGVSAFELVYTILLNCEQATYYTFLLCDEFNFLEILYNAITKGSYFIVYPASMSLLKIIEGCSDENDRFINENVFEALLKMMLMDNINIQKKAINAISIIFERSNNNSDSDVEKCITAFDINDGVSIFANCLYSSKNVEISQCCNRFLLRFFPVE